MSYETVDSKGFNIEIESSQIELTDADTTWLEALRPGYLNAEWFADSNLLIAVGSANLVQHKKSEAATRISESRDKFYGEQLGWASEDHPLHSSYLFLSRAALYMPPPATAVSSFRVLNSAGVDVFDVAAKAPHLIKQGPDSIEAKLELLTDFDVDVSQAISSKPETITPSIEVLAENLNNLDTYGLDINTVTKKFPKIITYPAARIARRIRSINRVARMLQWEGSVTDLINYFPTILVYSDEKLMVHIRLLRDFCNTDMTFKEVANHIIVPAEVHLISLSETQRYHRTSLMHVQKRTTASTRKAEARDLLLNDRERMFGIVGEKTLRAYEKYAAK